MAKRKYMAYLLRLWRENQDGSWRALLENPNSSERVGFATLAELVTFLETQTGEAIYKQPNVNVDDTPSSQAAENPLT